MSRLAGHTAVVTGASKGIGAATAAALADAGARVVGLARSHQARKADTRWDIVCDLTDARQVQAAADDIVADWGTPSIVVNNAGTFLLRPLEETSLEDFDAQLAVNLRAPFVVARAFVPPMRLAHGGILVTLGSVADHQAFPENAAYAASKFGVRGFHETLVAELQGSGVRCCLVSPGPTDTAAWDPVDPDHREGFLPRRAMLRPSDVAEAVLFVVSRPAHVMVDWLRVGPT